MTYYLDHFAAHALLRQASFQAVPILLKNVE
jgi:hypothetical protein